MTLEHFHSSGKIPIVMERLEIQPTEEAIRSAHSRRSKTRYGFRLTIGHFTVVCSVPWPLNRSETSYVNDHVHGLVSMRIQRFADEKQEGL